MRTVKDRPMVEYTKMEKLSEFYLHTPIVKFVSHTFFYLVFLVLMSYSAMTEMDPPPDPVNCSLPLVNCRFDLSVFIFCETTLSKGRSARN